MSTLAFLSLKFQNIFFSLNVDGAQLCCFVLAAACINMHKDFSLPEEAYSITRRIILNM